MPIFTAGIICNDITKSRKPPTNAITENSNTNVPSGPSKPDNSNSSRKLCIKCQEQNTFFNKLLTILFHDSEIIN
jgi:hypothetical protein